MALTGLDIFKHLPKTNCGDCGVPTCLAFAMKLSQGTAELASCPHVSDEAVAALSEAAAPPMRGVTVGTGDVAFKVGEETVLYRHEKTFVNACAIGVEVSAADSDDEIAATVAKAEAASFERVQQHLGVGLVAVRGSGDAARFKAVVELVMSKTALPLALLTEDGVEAAAALEACAAKRPLICAATEANFAEMAALAKENDCPLVVRAEGLEALSALTATAAEAGLKDIILDSSPATAGAAFRDSTFERRSALVKKFAPLGYPTISFPSAYAGGDAMLETVYAAVGVDKYASIIVVDDAEPEHLLPLLVLRQNIYTDPQRPMQAEPKVYEFGNPGPDSPFYVTTNFSLTYFIVASEIEASKAPAYLGVVEAEGLSVLTAWAAGKFVPERIAKSVTDWGMADKLSKQEVIIPGLVAQISGELSEELDGWNIVVGPNEAADLPAFAKQRAS